MKYTPSSRDALDAHCREVIRSCLNIVEQHGDTYVAIHCYDNTVEHTVGTVNGQYWIKVDIGTQEGETDTEEEPV